jgi:hypothetical protein
VDDRHDLRQRLENLAVDVALDIGGAAVAAERLAVLAEHHDVGGGDEAGRHAAGQ